MQKIKFDFEATKERIYAPNSSVPIGAPVDENGNIANDGNAIGIVLGYDNVNEKCWTKQMMVVMVGGYVDTVDAQLIWGGEYSAEAIDAMSNIIFCDDHKIGGSGSDPAVANAKETGGFGWTESGEKTYLISRRTVHTDGSGECNLDGVDLEAIAPLVKTYPESNGHFIINGEEYDYCWVYYDDENDDRTFKVNHNVDPFVPSDERNVIYQNGGGTAKLINAEPNTDVTVELYIVEPGIVHTIDPKYISGGAMVVHFKVDTASGAPTLIADKTVDEVKTAMLTMPVSGILTAEGTALVMSLMSNYGDMSLCFVVLSDAGEDVGYKSAVLVKEESGEWALHG